jgi:molybdopterin converting factor small subunit
MIRVQVPPSLGTFAENQDTLELSGSSVQEVLAALRDRYPELARHLLKEDGAPRSYVNLYVNGESIRSLAGLDTPLTGADTLTLVPSIAGG